MPGWDWGTPAILQITLLYGCGFGLKKSGLADPPPQLGQKPDFFQKSNLKAPLPNHVEWNLVGLAGIVYAVSSVSKRQRTRVNEFMIDLQQQLFDRPATATFIFENQ